MSQFAFCMICLLILILSYRADKSNKKRYLIGVILVLSFTAGLRSVNVGIDTKMYDYSFVNDFPYSWQFDEEGFRLISRSLMSVFDNSTWLFFIFALITNGLIILRLWDFKEKSSFSFMVFLYLTINYIGTMNIMRQYLAVALIFYATRYLERKKYIVFFITLAVATSIHSTSLLGSVFPVVYVWSNVSAKQKKWLILPLTVIIPASLFLIIQTELAHILNYLSESINNINITFLFRVSMFLLIMVLQSSRKQLFFIHSKNRHYLKPIKWSEKNTFFYIIGLATASFGMFFFFLSRVGIIYLMFEMVFWGRAVKEGRSNQVALVLSSAYGLYVFFQELIYNGSQIFPYSINWF